MKAVTDTTDLRIAVAEAKGSGAIAIKFIRRTQRGTGKKDYDRSSPAADARLGPCGSGSGFRAGSNQCRRKFHFACFHGVRLELAGPYRKYI